MGVIEASGSIATFESSRVVPLKSCSVSLAPSQDLHGYDNPWPAGGWKNVLPPYENASETKYGITLTNNNGEYTLNGTATSRASFDIPIDWASGDTYTLAFLNPSGNGSVAIYLMSGQYTVDVNVAASTVNTTQTFTLANTLYNARITVAGGTTLSNFKISPVIVKGSTAPTAWTPYSNICPITGHTGLKVTRTGKNLLDSSGVYSTNPNAMQVIKKPDGSFQLLSNYQNALIVYINPHIHIPLIKGKTYSWDIGNVINCDTAQATIRDKNGDVLRRLNAKSITATYTITEDGCYLADAFIRFTADQSVSVTVYPMFCEGEFTSYEPYNSKTVEAAWGKNLLDISKSESGGIDASGNPATGSTLWRANEYISVKPNATYYFRACNTVTFPGIYRIYYYDVNKTFVERVQNSNGFSFTVPESIYYIKWSIFDSTDIDAEKAESYKLQLELGSTATPYAPYTGIGTVYSGTINVATGELVVDRAIKNVQMSLGNYNTTINALLFFSSQSIFSDALAPSNNNVPFSAIADSINVNSASTINGGGYGIGLSATKDVYLRTAGASSKDDYLSIFPNGINVVYELATPLTYHLTPQEITTLIGQNNVWSDAGDISVSYSDLFSTLGLDTRRNAIIASQPHLEEESGAMVSFTGEGYPLKSCVADVEPIQDLHGYDNPWPAGGGKNLINPLNIVDQKYVKSTGRIDNTTGWSISGLIPVVPGTTYVLNIENSGTAAYHAFYNGNEEFVSSIISTTSPITIPDGIAYIRLSMKTLTNDPAKTAQFERGTISTAWTPYSNICPITGWTGAKVTRTGKNLIPYPYFDGSSKTTNGVTFNVSSDGQITLTGTATNTAYFNLATYDTYFLHAGTYIIKKTGKNGVRVTVNGTDNVNVAYAEINDTTFTITSATPVGLFIRVASGTVLGDGFIVTPQIELGSTTTPYEPYTGQTVDVQFPAEAGTVYGGTLDVTTGELVVDRAEVDMGTLTWTVITGNNLRMRAGISGMQVSSSNRSLDIVCSMYKTNINGGAFDDKTIYNIADQSSICVYDSDYNDPSVFKAAVSGETIVYPLATPITYHLTPQEITTLLGTNHMWADTGDLTVKYWKH